MEATTTLATLFQTLGGQVSTVLGWVGSVATTIIDTPLLSMSLVFFIIGGSVGILGRLLSKN